MKSTPEARAQAEKAEQALAQIYEATSWSNWTSKLVLEEVILNQDRPGDDPAPLTSLYIVRGFSHIPELREPLSEGSG